MRGRARRPPAPPGSPRRLFADGAGVFHRRDADHLAEPETGQRGPRHVVGAHARHLLEIHPLHLVELRLDDAGQADLDAHARVGELVGQRLA